MKRALCMILFAAAFVGSASAYTWTGGGADNRWTNPSNWGGGGYPQSTTDTAEFTTDATVSLDSGNTLTVGIVKVAANKTVTVNGTAGSALNPYRAAAVDGNGFLVAEGGKLVLNVPVISSGRIDKWLPGEVVFNADVTVTGNVYFLIDCGTVTVQGTAVFSLPDGQLGLGNSKNRQLMQLNIRDSARVVARTLETIVASNPNTGTGRVVQDGENTAVFVSGNTILAGASGRDDKGVYELKAGTFTSGGTVYFGKTGLGSTQSPYGGGRFVQSGGRAVISNNFSVAALNTAARHDGSAIDLSGGTFVYAPPLNTQFVLGAPLNLSGRPCRHKKGRAAKSSGRAGSIYSGTSCTLSGISSISSLKRNAPVTAPSEKKVRLNSLVRLFSFSVMVAGEKRASPAPVPRRGEALAA